MAEDSGSPAATRGPDGVLPRPARARRLAATSALRALKDLCRADAAGFAAQGTPDAPLLLHLPQGESPSLSRRLRRGQGLGEAEVEAALRASGYGRVIIEPARWQGRCCGYLYVAFRSPQASGQPGREVLAVFGQHAALALGLAAETGAKDRQVEVLGDIIRLAGRTREPRRMLGEALGRILSHLRLKACALYLLRPDGGLRLCARRGDPARGTQRLLREVAAASLPLRRRGRVFRQAAPSHPSVRAWPLASQDRVFGALALAFEPGKNAGEEEGLLAAVAGQLSVALQNALLLKEIREKARRLARAYGELKDIEELKEDFLSGITHDLKTPLVPVVGLIRLLAGGRVGELSERQAEYLAICLRNLDKHVNLIDDLIDYTRAKGGQVELIRESVDLREVVAGSLELLEVMARGQGVTVQASLGEESLRLLADRGKLGRILSNLFSNAVKFSRGGGEVAVNLSREGARAVLEVADTGIGIPPDKVGRIFERFYKAGPGSGTGLGLSVVKMLVDLLGGEISVVSSPGQGSRFRIAFRLEEPPAVQGGSS